MPGRTGSVTDAGLRQLDLTLTDPNGADLYSRNPLSETWSPVASGCEVRAMNLNGGTTPPGTSQPAVQLGPACAAPGDTWEVRLREEGDPGGR